ncbi:hypothetical protein [Butyricimonas paravirosa]|uniref:hypothetical protein n=1 Tax=Butyricimonas paravirosa TaxID=1472417 RepID=UPI00210AB275|nr:hypothetical protein [Butyricimonas paravirosa]MCQ4875791.1 hypothetical protein [Butyricimonas paravirosa]
MIQIFEINDLQKLREYLSKSPDLEKIRTYLFTEFLKHSRYKNAAEWNKAVRLCECLAIVGWGNHEPLEAIRGIYFNGNPDTFFINRHNEPRFLEVVWSKRKGGVAIDFERSYFHESPDAPLMKEDNVDSNGLIGEIQDQKLCSQRNWIPKNPIYLTRGIANCYESSKAVIESLEKELKPELNHRMRPELYGNAVNRIILNCSFSFYDNYHCKCNYIIADETLKLKQKDFYPALLNMFSKEEIEDNGYYLRNRFSYGPFKPDTGMTRVEIVFEKEFSKLPQQRQKQLLCEYFIHAIQQVASRLNRKIDYNFPLMITDFTSILKAWCEEKYR